MKKVERISKFWIWVVLSVLLALGYWIPSQTLAAEPVYALRLTNPLQAESLVSKALENWGKDLEKRTNGRIKLKYYPNATLASMPQQYDAVVKGIAEVGMHILGNTMGRFPLSEVLDLPLGWPNSTVATRIANEYYEKFKPKELETVKVLWLHEMGPGWLCTLKKPVNTLEDLKGMKMRTAGNNANYMRALGGVPVAMPMTEVYDALSRGMVDGLSSAYEALENWKTGEFVRYVTENKDSTFSATFLVAMNKKYWEALPKDIQTVIDQMSKEQVEKFGKAWDEAYRSGKDFVTKRGTKIITLSKEEEVRWVEKGAKPIVESYVTRMKEKGLPGEEAVKFVQERLKAIRK
ncbi:MAG: TRAP transporter substrate-binding protein [Deltaproteobacteria bacterium]|nr:TRAP transporter substrate-binding protein [Deltaproteobacteria bacterium]